MGALTNTPIRVLAVDDRPDNLLSIEATLRSAEYEVVTAASGRDALRYLLDNDCALILLDVQMPEMDGFETARLIHQSPRSKDTPIIFLTAISKERDFVGRGYATGAVDYLLKPFDPEILKSKVGVFAALHRSRQELLALRDAERLRERAELELRTARRMRGLQKRYQDLVSGISHAVIWSAEPESLTTRYVSPSTSALLRLSPESWGEPDFWSAHLVPEEKDRVMAELRSVVISGVPRMFEHRFIRGDGTTAWLQTSAHLAESGFDVLELHGLSVDLTPRKQAEVALSTIAEASRELAASLQLDEAVSRFLAVVVPRLGDWAFVELQGAAEDGTSQWWGRSEPIWDAAIRALCSAGALENDFPSTEPGEGVQVRHPRVDREAAAVMESLVRGPIQLRCLHELAPRSVMVVPLRTSSQTFGRLVLGYSRQEADHEPASVMLAEELGRRLAQALDNVRLYREVQESVRIREDFMSIASHELRTPLTSLRLHIAALERILGRGSIPTTIAQDAGMKVVSINRQTERLTRLVESLLDVARIRTGKLELQREELELESIIQEVLGRFRDELAREGITVALRLGRGLRGFWDRSRIDQVLTNLISNAVKYGGHHPIDISAEERDGMVMLSVEDRGIGIEGPNPERVFRRFERAVDARSFGGLGLGLFIVQQLVEAHGGQVSVQTESGRGSTFTVQLPRGLPATTKPAMVAERRVGTGVASGVEV